MFGICILGTGMISRDMAKAIQSTHPDSKIYVATVGSRSLESAKAFLSETGHQNHSGLPAAIPLGSYSEAMKHPSVHGVYVALPTGLEEAIVLEALNYGKHVLADKPLLNAQSHQKMTALAAEKSLLLMDATHFVHNPRTQAIRDYVTARSHPNTRTFHTLRATFCAGPMDEKNIRLDAHLEPMGAIGDLGWYTARAAVEFLTQSKVKSVVSANANPSVPGATVTRGQSIVSFEDGTTLVSTVAFANAWDQSLLLIGDDFMIELDDFVLDAHNSGFYNDPKTPLSFRVRRSKDRNYEVIKVDTQRPAYSLMFEQFAKSTSDVKSHSYWAGRTQSTQQIVDAMFNGKI